MAKYVRRPATGLKRLGWVLGVLPWLLVGYETARVVPVFVNASKITECLKLAAAEYHEGDDPEELTRSVDKYFKKKGVKGLKASEVLYTHDGSQWTMEAAYDDRAPLFFDISVVVNFHSIIHTPKAAPR